MQKYSDMFVSGTPKKETGFKEFEFNRQLPQISPRISQMDSFLNQGMKTSKRKPKHFQNDFSIFYGKQPEEEPRDTQVRIRGKSNIVKTQEGSFLHSLNDQKEERERKKHLKQAKKRIQMLNKLEDYRHKKLLQEIETIEEEKRKQELGKLHDFIS